MKTMTCHQELTGLFEAMADGSPSTVWDAKTQAYIRGIVLGIRRHHPELFSEPSYFVLTMKPEGLAGSVEVGYCVRD